MNRHSLSGTARGSAAVLIVAAGASLISLLNRGGDRPPAAVESAPPTAATSSVATASPPRAVDPAPDASAAREVSTVQPLGAAWDVGNNCTQEDGVPVCLLTASSIASFLEADGGITDWRGGELVLEYAAPGARGAEHAFVCLGVGDEPSVPSLAAYGVCALPNSGFVINAELDSRAMTWGAIDGDERHREPGAGSTRLLRVRIENGGLVHVGSESQLVGSRPYIGERQGAALVPWLFSSAIVMTKGVRLLRLRRAVTTTQRVIP